ncbi:MAG: ATP-binding cassette domain-containing protein [Nitrospirae bacterium]|nr:ATP-binding cassette domain-containing protein [Candidatus Manganitrophaceae bacterium]
MIEVMHLGKRYGEVVAIDDVSFSVPKGEILAFLGPNGAGKTTTMRILTCFMPATSGTARVAGFDIFESPMEVKRRIGYLPENPPVYPELTVSEYLRFVAKIKGVPTVRVKAALASALEKCNIGDVANRLIGNLSRGYRQRVGLAQAMIHNPDVLILDEPTVGLDPKQIIEIRELIKNLGGEHTIVLSTHILPEATAVCQKVVIINRGRIVAVDSQERLSAQVRKSEKISVRVRRGESVNPEQILSIAGVHHLLPQPASDGEGAFIVEVELGRDVREELARRVVESGWGLLEMKPLTVSLEEVFLQLTTEEKGVEAVAAPAPTEGVVL